MKNTYKALLAVLSVLVVMAACTKEPPLFVYKNGTGTTLAISDTSFGPIASDSNLYRLKMKWGNPNFATDLSNVKFITQIDFAGKKFSNPYTQTVYGAFSDSVQNKVLNKWLLDNGVAFAQYANLEIRLVYSYSNNNDMMVTEPIPFRFRAYKIPPKIVLPVGGDLFLVGSATQGGWSNPVPTPTQQFARLSETSWGGVFQLNGGAQYLVLPKNGDWGNKYSVANTGLAGLETGGDFGFNLPGNFPGPAADGLYKIIFDFQIGKFTVEPFTMQHGLPTKLVVVGGATPWGWNNSVDNPQKLKQLNAAEWQIATINLKANDGYLILPEPGNWGKKYGVPNNSLESAKMEGTFKPEGQDFKSPATAGDYRILMNFVTEQYRLTKL